MNYTILFTHDAVADFNNISDFIAQDNPYRALTFIDELQKRTKTTLSLAPYAGQIYKEKTRYIILSEYVVLYETEDSNKTVNILRIIHSLTNWNKL
jgi:plasmid stabilization system protein ParE